MVRLGLPEEEEGGLDVEHGVQVLQQQLLLVLHVAGGELVDCLVVERNHIDCKMFWFSDLGKPGEFLDCKRVSPKHQLVVHRFEGDRFLVHLIENLSKSRIRIMCKEVTSDHLDGDFLLEVVEADQNGLIKTNQLLDSLPFFLSERDSRTIRQARLVS